MRTFSGRQHINESILSSVKAGKSSYIERLKEWCKDKYINLDLFDIDFNKYEINDTNKKLFTLDQYPNSLGPIRFGDMYVLNLIECAFEEFVLPRSANEMFISRCNKLKTIKVEGESTIGTLLIENCETLDFANIDFSGLKVDKLIIKNCPNITSLKGFSNVKKLLKVSECESFLDFDFEPSNSCVNTVVVNINKCKFKSFSAKLSGKRVKFEDCKTGKKASMQIGKLTELTIDNLHKCTTLSISGNVEQCDIIDCDIESLEAPNCMFALSLIDLISLNSIKAQNNKIKGRIVVSSNDTMDVVKKSGIKCNKVVLG